MTCAVFFSSASAHANKFWVATTLQNWNSASWALTSGGVATAGIPVSTDTVIFDGAKVGSCTINVNVTVSSFTISTSTIGGYTGTITMLSSTSVTALYDFAVNKGTFSAPGSIVTVKRNFSVNLGTFTTTTSSITVEGSWTLTAASVFTSGTSTVTFSSSTANATITSAGKNFGNVIFAKTGSWILQDSMTVTSTMTLSGGTLDTKSAVSNPISIGKSWLNTGGAFTANQSTVTFNGTLTTLQIDADPSSFSNLVFSGAGTWTLQSPLSVTSTMTFTAGILNTGSNYPITVGGSWMNNGGTFTSNSSTVTFSATSVGQKIKTNNKNFGNVQFTGSGGYWTLQDSMSVTAMMTLAGGTLDSSASNLGITVGNSWINNGGAFVANLSTVTFIGASSTMQLDPNPSPFSSVVFNGAGTWTLQSSMTVTSTITFTAGTLDTSVNNYGIKEAGSWINNGGTLIPNLSTVTFTASAIGQRIKSNAKNFAYVQFNNAGGYWTLQDSMTALADINLAAGTLDTKSGSNFGITAGGEWMNTGGTFVVNLASVTFTGSGSNLRVRMGAAASSFYKMSFIGSGSWQTDTNPLTAANNVSVMSGDFTVASGSSMTITGTLIVAGTGSLLVNEDTKLTGILLNTGGTIDSSDNTAVFTTSGTFALGGTGDTNFPTLILSGAGQTSTLAGRITVEGDFTNSATHTFTTSGTNYAVTVAGNWSNLGTFTANSSSVTFNGTSAGKTIAPGASNFFLLRLNGPGGAWTTTTNTVTASSNVVIDAGTLTIANNAMTVTGDVDVNAGGALAINQNLTINGGDFTNDGTVTSLSTALVTIASTGTLGGAGTTTLPKLTMTGNGQTTTVGGDISVVSSMTIGTGHILDGGTPGFQITISSYWANQGTFNAHQSEVVFNSTAGLFGNTSFYNFTAGTNGITLTFTAGSTQTIMNTLSLTGAVGNEIKLRSGVATTAWSIKSLGTSSVSGVDVKDSDARFGSTIAPTSSINSGNNRNWDFGAGIFTWWGSVDTVWSNAQNWDFGLPGPGDAALIVSSVTSGRFPTLTADVTISTLTINAGSTVTLAGFDLNLSSFTNAGTLALSGTENVTAAPTSIIGSTVNYIGTTGLLPIRSTWTYANLMISGTGNFFLPDDITVAQNLRMSNTGTFDPGTNTVTFNGVSASSITSGGRNFYNVTFNGAGSWVLQDSMTVTSSMTLTAGTLDTKPGSNFGVSVGAEWLNTGGTFTVNTTSVTFTGAGSNLRIRQGLSDFYRLSFTGPGSWLINTNPLTLTNNISIMNGTLTVPSGSSMTVVGTFIIGASGNFMVNEDVKLTGALINAGVLDTTDSTANFTSTGSFTLGGTGDTNFPTFSPVGVTQTTTLGGRVTVKGDFINPVSHTFTTSGTNYPMTVGGNWSNLGTFTANSSSVTFNGTASGKTIAPGASTFFLLRINGAGGGWTTTTNTVSVTSNVIVDAGSLTIANNVMTVTGDVDVNSGGTLAINQNLTVNGGDLTNDGTITSLNTALVTMASTGTLGGAGTTTLPKLTMTGVGQTTTLGGDIAVASSMTIATNHILDAGIPGYQITISSYWANQGAFTYRQGEVVFNSTAGLFGNTSFYNFTAGTNGITLTFTAGSTQTIMNTLSLTGAVGNEIKLRSGLTTSPWSIKSLGTSSVTGVDVKDSDARFGNTIAPASSINSGNNRNWDFGSGVYTWWGSVDTVWSNVQNWDFGLPGPGDAAVIVSTALSGRWPVLTGDVTISTLTINAGSTVTLAGFNLNLSSFTNAGTLALSGTENVTAAPTSIIGSTVNYIGSTGLLQIRSTWTYTNLMISGTGNFFLPDDITVAQNLRMSNTGTFDPGTNTVTFNGVAASSITSGGRNFYNVTFNGAGSWVLQDSMTVTSSMTLTAGTLDTKPGSNFGVSVGAEWLNTGGTFSVNTASITFTGSGSNLRIRQGSAASSFYKMSFLGSGSWQTATNPLTAANNVSIVNGTLTVASGSSMTVVGTFIIASGGSLMENEDMKLTGSLLNAGSVDTADSTAIFTGSGTFTLGGTGGTRLPTLTLGGAAQTTTSGGNLTVAGDFTNSLTHTFTTSGTNFSVTVAGSWSNVGTFTANSSSVTFNGTASGKSIAPGASTFFLLRLNGSGGAWTTTTNTVAVSSNVIIDAGTLTVANNAMTVTGDVDVNAGGALAINQNLTVNGGDLTNDGTITSLSTALVTMASTGTLGGGGTTTLPKLTMTGVGQTTTLGGDIAVVSSMTIGTSHILDAGSPGFQITISSYWANQGTFNAQQGEVVFASTGGLSGNTTFYNFTATTAGITLTALSGSTQTVLGTLLMSGAPGNPIKLRSSTAAQNYFKVTVSSWVSNVDVQFSKATGNTMYAGRTSTNSLNNTNWVFDYYPAAIANFSAAAQADGTVLLSWSAPLDVDDNPMGTGSQYAIEWATYTVVWSTSNVGDTISSDTWHMYVATSAVDPGDGQVYVSTPLAGNGTYNFRIWTMDPAGSWSPISNNTSATANPLLAITLPSHTYNFGSVSVGQSTETLTSLSITNGGNVSETYSLSVATTGPKSVWHVGVSTPTSYDTFALFGAFHAVQPSSSTFANTDIITGTPTPASASVYSIDGSETGLSTPMNSTRDLWLRLEMPLTVSTTDQEQLNVTVTANTP